MSKTKKIIIAVSLLIVLIGGYALYQKNRGDDSSKHIHVILQNKDTVIYDKEVKTNASKLSELLIEMKENKEIQLAYENSAYGMYITGMGVDELYKNDEAASLYWVYDSKNNAQCQENTYCDAADSLVIEDKDEFVFTLKGMNE